MNNLTILLVLILAALLEAGGDALARSGLHAAALPVRLGFFAVGAVVLFSYGITVNLPNWDFGRLLASMSCLFSWRGRAAYQSCGLRRAVGRGRRSCAAAR